MDHSTLSIEPVRSDEPTQVSQEFMVRLVEVYKKLGGKQILQGASLDITPAETRVVIGRSGEGKSVLIKHICGLMKADQGQVVVDGEDITHHSEHELFPARKKIGLLFQNAALFDSLNILHNVGFALFEQKTIPPEEIEEQVVEVLKRVRLGDILNKMPSELSGGMKKRVGLARAIIQKPKILLYDEPTTGLDPVTSDAINELIIDLAEDENMTSIVITHDMTSAFKVGTQISMLYEGKILFTGSPDETKETDNPIVQQFIQGNSEGPLTNM